MGNTTGFDKKGFTLIEIIVVVAIIGVLTVMSVFGVGVLQRSSRDSLRLKALEEIKSEITRVQTQTGRIPTEGDITWGEEEIIIAGRNIEPRKVKVEGLVKPKGGGASLCSPTLESDSSGTVYCYKVERDGYVLGADKESGVIDIGTSTSKFADIRK
ncbi:prepilin-type N-terminal cleavage/methylation domain-containing protein [Candidatus Dojkabacteria bacterium]|nr:prepilin-type N-terminal cleavage/methylation domain-containing protein [Candidatus Dojkabacteria bacterium]